MPIYEYKCKKGHVFDALQRMSDDPLETCEKCGAPVQRVFHPVAVHFKGSGFYNTDYGTKRRQREAKENSASSEGGGSNEKKSEKSESKDSKKSESSTASASASSSSSSKSD